MAVVRTATNAIPVATITARSIRRQKRNGKHSRSQRDLEFTKTTKSKQSEKRKGEVTSMTEIIYRVIIKVSYHEAFFEFESAEDAAAFARVALTHMVTNEDTKKTSYIAMQIVDPKLEGEDD